MDESWRTLRIFISSTFRDMQAERDHLVRFVFPRLREELLSDHVHLVDIDLRWGVTSEQAALQVCKDVIDECRPRFIGLLGGRYGWTPPGQSCSITEEEILYGVLDAKTKPQAFFYYRDEAATEAVSAEQRGFFVEASGGVEASKLKALKERIRLEGCRVFPYPAKWDETSRRFVGLHEFGERVHLDLLTSIRRELKQSISLGQSGTAPKVDQQDLDFESFIEEKVARFVPGSRQKTLDQLMAFVTGDAGVPLVVVTGEPGTGKSALLARFYRDCHLKLRAPLVICHFVGATAESTDLRWMLKRICLRLAAIVDRSIPIPEETQELIDLFPRILRQAAAKRRIVLIIDAINQLGNADSASNMRWLPLEFPPNVRVILSSLEHPALAAIRSRAIMRSPESVPTAHVSQNARLFGFREIALSVIPQEDALEMIESFLSRYGKRLDAGQARTLIAKPDGCNALYLLTALEELRTLGEYHEITEQINKLPGRVGPLFDWIFADRLPNDPKFRDQEGRFVGKELLRNVVGLLAASRSGLSQREIIALADPDDPHGNVGALLRLLRPYLMQRGELLDFYHGQVRASAERVFLAQRWALTKAHERLAQYFAGRGYEDARAIAEIVFHSVRCQDWKAVRENLVSLEYIEARAAFQQYYDMISEYDAVLEREPPGDVRDDLREFSRFIRSQSHVLSKFPGATFQQAANQPTGTAPERAASQRIAHSPKPRSWVRWVNKPPKASKQLMTIAMLKPEMTACAFDPTGNAILMTYADGTASLWSVETGVELSTYHLDLGTVTACALMTGGRHAAFGDSRNRISIVDLLTGVTVSVLRGGRGPFTELRFSGDGLTLSSCSGNARAFLKPASGEARIWDVKSGRTLHRPAAGFVPVLCCRFAEQNRGAWVVLANSTTKRFLPGNQSHASRFPEFQGAPLRTAGTISRDGKLAVWGTAEGDVILADVLSGRMARPLKGHTERITAAVLTHNDSLLVTSSYDSTVRLWNVSNGQCLQTYSVQRNKVLACSVNLAGTQILSVSNDGFIRCWELSTAPAASERIIESTHREAVTSCDFSPDGNTFATSSLDGSVRVWDSRTGAGKMTFADHNGPVYTCKFSASGQEVVSAAFPSDVMIWPVAAGNPRLAAGNPRLSFRVAPLSGRWAIGFFRRFIDGLTCMWLTGALIGVGIAICSLEIEHLLALFAVGLLIGIPFALSAGRSYNVSVRAFAAYVCLVLNASLIGDHFLFKSAIARAINAPWAATIAVDAVLGVLASGFLIAFSDIAYGSTQTVKSCDVSADNEFLLAGTHSGAVSIFDFRSGRPVKSLADNLITSLAARLSRAQYTSDLRDTSLALGVTHCAYLTGGQIAAVSHDIQNPVTWDGKTGKRQTRFSLSQGSGAVGASHRDGTVAICSKSGRLALWKISKAGTRQIGQVVAHDVLACCFSPTCDALLTVSADGWARIYSVPHLANLYEYPAEGILTAAAWSPDGRSLSIGNKAGSVFLLEMIGSEFSFRANVERR